MDKMNLEVFAMCSVYDFMSQFSQKKRWWNIWMELKRHDIMVLFPFFGISSKVN